MSPLSMAAQLMDVLLVVIGAVLAQMLTHHGTFSLPEAAQLLTAIHGGLVLLLFPGCGLYRSWRGQRLPRLASRVIGVWGLVTLIGVALVFAMHQASAISRLWFGTTVLLTAGLFVAERVAVYLMLQRLRHMGLNQKTVVIVGPETHSRAIVEQIRGAPYAGFQPLWLFDEHAGAGHRVGGLEVMTQFSEFAKRVRSAGVDEIWLALPLSEEHTIHRFVREFRNDFVNLRFLPDVRGMSLFSHSVTEIIGMPSIDVAVCPISEFRLWPKLIFDRIFAACALIGLLPLFAVLGVLIKLSSPGPVLFRQMRKGVDGHQFEILKFRTMKMHATEPGHLVQATRHDPRVTPLGAFLRRTSLDELPQFFNVLMGEMSVVGPRPHAIEHDDLYKDLVGGYMYRYRIKPGITGWAQVNGCRGETRKLGKMEARVKFDLFYMQNWSFWFDIKIILLTIVGGFLGRNAF